MRKVTALLSAAAAAMALCAAASAQAATTLSVGWSEGCGKATCFNDQGVFTQTFSAKDFGGGPIAIGQLLLDRGVLGAMDGATFSLSFALNGETVGTWGRYTMSGIGGEWLTFGGEEFSWNPEDGDLVLILALNPPPAAGLGGFFANHLQDGPLGDDPPPFHFSGAGVTLDQGGRQAAVVPEPGAWALMIAGFGLAGAAFRQRRRLQPAQVT